LLFRHVSNDRNPAPTSIFDFLNHQIKRGLTARNEDDRRTVCGKQYCGSFPDARTGAGNYGYFPV
jgi:hypothetical protein